MKFPQDSVHQKLLKLVHFRRAIQNIKNGDVFWDTVWLQKHSRQCSLYAIRCFITFKSITLGGLSIQVPDASHRCILHVVTEQISGNNTAPVNKTSPCHGGSFLSSIFRRELNIHGAWSFCLSTDLDGYSWHLETGYSLRTEHQPFWYLVPPEIPFCIRGSITAANAAGNYVDCKKFVIHSKRRSLSRFVAVWYRFHIYAIQAAVLCGSTTTTTAENCRKPQIYRREDREGTALTAIKA